MIKVKIDEVKENEKNPKKIDWFKLEQLKKSLKDFPEMLKVRPIVVNKDNVIIGGNMRWRAAKELGWLEVWIRKEDENFREDEFMIKDNLNYGDWNWEGLSHDFKSNELLDWGLDVPLFMRDEEIETFTTKSKKENKEDNDKPTSTKKALYLFFTLENKKKFLDKLKTLDGETNEEKFVKSIQNYLE